MSVRFDMNGLDDVVVLRVPPIIVRQVVFLEDVVVTEWEALYPLISQPGIVEGVEVPEVMMRIDDLKIGHGLPLVRLMPTGRGVQRSRSYGFHSGSASAPVRWSAASVVRSNT